MKTLALIAVCLLAGCSSYTTLEDLERQAMKTGDWTAVEKRERIIARRNARSGPQCGAGYVGYCESYGGSDRCACLSSDAMRDLMAGWQY